MMSGIGGPSGAQGDATVFDDNMSRVTSADMAYPSVAMAARLQGVVVVAVTLDDEGRVTSASATSGLKALIPDSLGNAKKWTFKPSAQKRAVIVYDFRIEGLCQTGGQSLFRTTQFNQATISTCGVVMD
jgi:TonB family protein